VAGSLVEASLLAGAEVAAAEVVGAAVVDGAAAVVGALVGAAVVVGAMVVVGWSAPGVAPVVVGCAIAGRPFVSVGKQTEQRAQRHDGQHQARWEGPAHGTGLWRAATINTCLVLSLPSSCQRLLSSLCGSGTAPVAGLVRRLRRWPAGEARKQGGPLTVGASRSAKERPWTPAY
jgi:hypothetical protein